MFNVCVCSDEDRKAHIYMHAFLSSSSILSERILDGRLKKTDLSGECELLNVNQGEYCEVPGQERKHE